MTIPTEVEEEQDLYPSNDGKPMSDNTLQFQWIMVLQGNLDVLFQHLDVFVAGDLLWYPVRGQPKIRIAPDALVAFGRPKGYRKSYLQWRENNIPPQVVFEVLSPGNTQTEMEEKLEFYDRYGVEEYYLYDPDGVQLWGWERRDEHLQPIEPIDGWRSPRLSVCFDLSGAELVIYRPDGERFLTFLELAADRERARRQAEAAHRQVDEAQRQLEEARRDVEEARRQAEETQREVEQARLRAQRLAERLRALGIDPEDQTNGAN